jgi:hypothetical protein
MAIIRKQFNELDQEKLKILIIENMKFINEVAPFKETQQIVANIKSTLKANKDIKKDDFQVLLLDLMQIIIYWEKNQGKNGLFNTVQKNIVAAKLQAAHDNYAKSAYEIQKLRNN